jgi:hypothetical protein
VIPTGHHHYVPVLKVKDGEKRAMRQLSSAIAARVTPLFEIVGRTDSKPVDQHLDTAFKGFAHAIAPFSRYFLDCREIAADGPAAAVDVFARAAALGKPFIPVTSVSRTSDVAAAMAHRIDGVAIRLSPEEFEAGTLPTTVPAFLGAHRLSPGDVDLIVDLGAIDRMIVTPGIADFAEQFLDDVPHHTAWRSLILSGCGFPRTLAGVKADSNGVFERVDWAHWQTRIFQNRGHAHRLPTYSDCGIQHRDGVEDIDFSKVKPAAAIRQGLPMSWHVEKGRSIRDNGGDQFQKLAANVIAATQPAATHCAGCAALFAAAANPKGYASLGKWRQFGTVHHITLTVENLASLPWP